MTSSSVAYAVKGQACCWRPGVLQGLERIMLHVIF